MLQNVLFDVALPDLVDERDEASLKGSASANFGRIGELLVEVELLRRGHEVAVPSVDTGVDLVVDCRWRVQVKSSSRLYLRGPGGYSHPGYSFRKKDGRGWASSDVWVFVASEGLVDPTFWVVPSSVLARRGLSNTIWIYLRPGKPGTLSSELEQYKGAWGVFGS